MDNQEVTLNKDDNRIIFTRETSFEDIQHLLWFDLKFSDLINIKKVRKVYLRTEEEVVYPSIIEDLEQKVSNAFLVKKKEILYSTIALCKEEIESLNNGHCYSSITSPLDINKRLITDHRTHTRNILQTVLQSVKNNYENEYNLSLKTYHKEAKKIFEEEKISWIQRLENLDFSEGYYFPFGKSLTEFIDSFWRQFFYPIVKMINLIELLRYCKRRINEIEGSVLKSKQLVTEVETLPTYEYKTETQKIAWLHELGILETVLNQCKQNDTIVWSRAANVISSFTCINTDTIRKCLQAIYQTNDSNKKNNPLNNEDNRLFVADMVLKFRLNK